MTWLLWRQHRSQAAVAGAALVLFAVAVLITGVHMAHVYDDAVRNCPSNGACELVGQLFRGYGAIVDTVHLTIAVPLLFGAFVGATLVAREVEQSTNSLVWTQTVTRRRWLLSKVAVAVGAALVWGIAVSALVTWWSGTPNSLYGNRFEGAQFDTQNVVPVACALFGVCLGIAAGCVFRRTLPALAATIAGYAAVRVAVAVYLRPHYLAPITRTVAPGADAGIPPGSWTLNSALVDPPGHVITGRLGIPDPCVSAPTRAGLQDCLTRIGYRMKVTYQPPSHYWTFQWIEAGLFVALAACLLTFAVIRTLRHDA